MVIFYYAEQYMYMYMYNEVIIYLRWKTEFQMLHVAVLLIDNDIQYTGLEYPYCRRKGHFSWVK